MQISLAFRSLAFGSLAFDGGGRAEDGGVDNRERWLCGRWLLGRWHLGGGGWRMLAEEIIVNVIVNK